MKRTRYIYQSLRYFRKQHLALLIGTIISTAVLTGALIIGDSVTHSLARLTEKRLGAIQYAMDTGERFVTDSLSVNMQKNGQIHSSSILHLNTVIIEPEQDIRIHAADIYGVDSSFIKFSNPIFEELSEEGFFISENIAERLQLDIGQEILVKIRNVDAIPVQTPFSLEKVPTKSLRLPVIKILTENEFSRFSLLSNQKAPYNIFVDKKLLQSKTDLDKHSNLLLFNSLDENYGMEELDDLLQKSFRPKDAALQIKKLEDGSILEVSSDRIFIDQLIMDSLQVLGTDNILTYLVNGISHGQNLTPYSFVSGLPENLLPYSLKENEIILNNWCAEDLGVQSGDSVTLSYFVIDAYRNLETQEKSFLVKGIEKNQGDLFRRELMPDFPGLSDAKSCSEWNTGIPIDLEKIRDKDEQFWEEFKGTPKAIVSNEAATSLWGNLFGKATSIRLPASRQQSLESEFGSLVPPGGMGFQIKDVKNSGLVAASNGVDFGELFLSLSFFVILSGILLLVLLYSLNMLSRKKEIDKLRAIGLSGKTIFRLHFSEVLIPVILGNILGVILGIIYNKILLTGLNGLWQGAVRTKSLEVFIDPLTLSIGFIGGTLISIITVFIVLRNSLKVKSIFHQSYETSKVKTLLIKIMAWVLMAASLLSLVYAIFQGKYQESSSYMAMGALLIISLLFFFWLYLNTHSRKVPVFHSVNSLALTYLSRNKRRSILTVSLLAFGTFSVLVTGMNRKTFYGSESNNASGTGGYLFWMETAIPLINDPNTKKGMEIYGFEEEEIIDSISFLPLLTLSGDDASCLNLNQVQNPGILGIEPSIPSERASFSFTKLLDNIDVNDPWMSLDDEFEEGIIPAFVDQTVITWGLMKSVGDTLLYEDEFGKKLHLIIAGGLANTIFQGHVLISQKNMQKYFPSVPGAKICLVDGNKDQENEISMFLDHYFQDYGADYTTSYERLDEFNSVTNTYLNVFLVLGAIGMLIGTIGFGIILLRNRMERRTERAIMSATGISKKGLGKLMRREHLILLFSGISFAFAGTLLASIPSMLSEAYAMPYLFVLSILGLILLSGLFWIYLFSGFKETKNLYLYLRKEFM